MTLRRFCCLLGLVCGLGSAARADYLQASRAARLMAHPQPDAPMVARVERSDLLQLLEDGRQTNGYYHVYTASAGQPGWVYRTFVRRFRGEVPAGVTEVRLADPLADPTLVLTSEQRELAARYLRLGKPQVVYERVRQGYVVGQDARLKIPLWVQYELRPGDLNGPAERRDDYRADASIPFRCRAEEDDYKGSAYDRGHMAPARDMTRDPNKMSESFLLSNMAPQVGVGFNRHIWAYLEAAVRGWVEQRGALTVITGPVFAVEDDRVRYQVIGQNRVAVPTHFYKIVVDVNHPEAPEALAFMLPNQNLAGRKYREFLCTIDEIEAATGLNFLSALPVEVQADVESRRAAAVW